MIFFTTVESWTKLILQVNLPGQILTLQCKRTRKGHLWKTEENWKNKTNHLFSGKIYYQFWKAKYLNYLNLLAQNATKGLSLSSNFGGLITIWHITQRCPLKSVKCTAQSLRPDWYQNFFFFPKPLILWKGPCDVWPAIAENHNQWHSLFCSLCLPFLINWGFIFPLILPVEWLYMFRV